MFTIYNFNKLINKKNNKTKANILKWQCPFTTYLQKICQQKQITERYLIV
jgi:hypothetical protein